MRWPSWNTLVTAAESAVASARRGLPPRLRAEAERLPVSYEPFPTAEMLEEPNVDEDTLGLFVGQTHTEALAGIGEDHLPPQIVLFLENLWSYSEGHDPTYRAEVRRTYLHELGHWLGLDEDDLAARDLD